MMPAFWLLKERPGMFASESSKRMPSRQHEQACYCKKRQLWRRKTADLDRAVRVTRLS